jgi:hypothetical protein
MAEKRFRKGERVRFRYGVRWVEGVAEEDVGPIRVKGRHLYLVVFKAEPPAPSEIELPAEALESVTDSVSSQ